MAEKDIDKIEPVDVDINGNAQANPPNFKQIPPAPTNKPPVIVWIGLGALVIVALFVVFVLPTIVSEYELPLERRAETDSQRAPQTATSATTNISPFEEAQRAIQRKDAQDVLAELLAQQQTLDDMEVTQWGQAAYAAALEQASIGDEYYRNQDFILARNSYASGRDSLTRIIESIPTVLSQTLVDAQKALEEGNSAQAQEKFRLALLLDPTNEVARVGAERARSLDDVTALVATADRQLQARELQASRESYRAALNLDSHNDYARNQITVVSQLITEAEFARIMSSGYTLLQNGEPEEAIAAFNRASAIGINQDQAAAAIIQAENDIANVEISRLRALIAAAETNEDWQQAVDEYDNVLAIDANLVFAIEGRDYAAKRAQLDRLLVASLGSPERFAEDTVFQETRDIYFTGRAIDEPGPKLQKQLDELQVLLENSQASIEIQLISDNLTDVTLLRVGTLGLFEQTSLSLKPGVYVAVGKRAGYREVREEFTVGFGKTPDAVIVRCEERVATTTRR